MRLGRKGILKKILRDYLPDELILKEKKGFISPLDNIVNNINVGEFKLEKYFNNVNLNNNWKKLILRKMLFNKIEKMYS